MGQIVSLQRNNKENDGLQITTPTTRPLQGRKDLY